MSESLSPEKRVALGFGSIATSAIIGLMLAAALIFDANVGATMGGAIGATIGSEVYSLYGLAKGDAE